MAMVKQQNDLGMRAAARAPQVQPLAQAIALLLMAGGMVGGVSAQQAFSPAWFANKGAQQQTAAQSGRLPSGMPSNLLRTDAQAQKARETLQTSLDNLGTAAQAIAMQQRLQQSARDAARLRVSQVPDGLGQGGLKIDDDALTKGWSNASGPVQSSKDGTTTVSITQTADKAILNWETFNVGRNTVVDFDQQAGWSLLNRINDPSARPSQILGRIQGQGTVMLVNRNGVVFDGSSQVNVRNLAASAVNISDAQFRKGLYSDAQGTAFIPTFGNELSSSANSFAHAAATGDVVVERGAQITTHAPTTVTEGGGYVLLLGRQVSNHGQISSANGQTVLAAGDAFVIRKGLGTDQNLTSTTRGNVVTALRAPAAAGMPVDAAAGVVSNTGLVQASTGDITLVGHEVQQHGTLVATSSVHARGTIHLRNERSDTEGSIQLAQGSTTAIVLDDSATTALDVQRETLVLDSDKAGDGIQHRRDQSLVQIDTAGDVSFAKDSLTLATGGQVYVDARSTELQQGARIDVSGHVGVKIAMEANNVQINVQGNEQRDAPVNRLGEKLSSNNIWLDRRDLTLVPAGTNGYEADRWYTAGGLLEVGGYLGVTGHGIGEWSAQGGSVQFSGGNLQTRAGSQINLSGGTLDVQTGYIQQTHLKGADGRLYSASTAPGDLLYTGLYKGFESSHARWGTTEYHYNPLIGARQRLENGYVVGRDAGRMIVATQSAQLQGDIETATFQGDRQINARQIDLDGYLQAQTAVARNGQLVIGQQRAVQDKGTHGLRYTPSAVTGKVQIGSVPVAESDSSTGMHLDAAWLNSLALGGLQVYARDAVVVDQALQMAAGGSLGLHATQVQVNADLVARGGAIALGNIVPGWSESTGWLDRALVPVAANSRARTLLGEGVLLDTRGLWSNLQTEPLGIEGMPYVDGGSIQLRSSQDVLVARGARLDASSGAALQADDHLRGGRGGDIALIANALEEAPVAGIAAGQLSLQGDLRGHGVKGGGTLRLQSGKAVVIGGQVAGSDGLLRAGESAPIDLLTSDTFQVLAGSTLPVDYAYTRVQAQPGETLGTQPVVDPARPETHLTLGASWTPPKPVANADSYILRTLDGRAFTVNAWTPPPTLAAGTVVTQITGFQGGFPINYAVPADVFPQGIRVLPSAATLKAGSVAPTDIRFAAGTRIGAGNVLAQDVAVERPLQLSSELFGQGFARYEVTGQQSLAVAPGADLRVSMPVLQLDLEHARALRSGGAPGEALQEWLAPEFSADTAKATLQQRKGADLQLRAGSTMGALATLAIGEGAHLQVDNGRSIGLAGNGQITVDGTLQAHSGRIDILDMGLGEIAASPKSHDRSLWIGDHAVLDVSGVAQVERDARGQRFGQVGDGGRIQLGGRYDANATSVDGVDAFVVVRPGARLDASGASATLDVPGQGATDVAGDGGVLHLASFNGLFLEGSLRAAAGGRGAAGGTLSVALEAPNYLLAGNPDDRVRSLRELSVTQQQADSGLAAALQPGQRDPALVYGRAAIGVDRIQAGGFGNLGLLVNGVMSFNDGVDLAMSQGLRLTASNFSLAEHSGNGAQVALAAPYVRLAGNTRGAKDAHTLPLPEIQRLPALRDASTLRVEAGVLDVIESVAFGTSGKLAQGAGTINVQRDGFETVELRSRGDLRLLKSKVRDRSSIDTVGDLVLSASQIYPATQAVAEIRAGKMGTVDQWGQFQVVYDPARSLRVERSGDALPAAPLAAFGTLRLLSSNIEQGGVVRAPLGELLIGQADGGTFGLASRVQLLPGSVTSVSGGGLRMPYGGTKDGLTYVHDGLDAVYKGIGVSGNEFGGVTLRGENIDVQAGAVLDLSGGGELSGAAFLSGRGGSTDARLHPLVQIDANGGGFVLPGLSSNPVYAIVPGAQADAAPIAAEKGAGDPAIGRQIQIGAGVPGLPAGTYTLLPSTYALLPGAFRVELNGQASSQAGFGASTAMRNGSWSTAARFSTAGTDIQDALTSQVIVTAADTLRQYSQYNETSYAQFGLAWAQRDGAPRPRLERDAGRLTLDLSNRQADKPEVHALAIAPGSVRGVAASGGYGSELVVRSPGALEVLAPGSTVTDGFSGLSVHADALNAVGANTMTIGGTPTSVFQANRITQDAYKLGFGSNGQASSQVVLRSGAQLSAAQVFLVAGAREGGITVEQGASITTLGQGAAAWDSTAGYIFDPGTTAVLAVSNGWLDMLAPGTSTEARYGQGDILIGGCGADRSCSGAATLYAGGTLTAATTAGFELADSARYGARNLVLAVGNINVGSTDALARMAAEGLLPAGLTLNQQVLDRLLRGDASTGAPALEKLVLTAGDAVNFFDSVELSTLDASGKSTLGQLVLTAPAIRGQGDADAVARIRTDTLVWNGSARPAGDVVAGGAGTGSGQLQVDARQILFGYAEQSQPDTVAMHGRQTLGFGTVALNASDRISANHIGSLSVYQSQGAWNGQAKAFDYSGGDLLISTPLFTGAAGSINRIRAGGRIAVVAAQGGNAVASDPAAALGAELSLQAGRDLLLDTRVQLPSGKLQLAAQDDVRLGDGAQLDLAGRRIDMFDVSRYSWGGDVTLDSQAGSIVQAAGSRIDLSAVNNRGGRLNASALGAGAGTVSLAGQMLGGSSGGYDTGGTWVPYSSAYLDLRAQHIDDFAALNTRLNAGQVFGGRSFQLKQGDLVIGDGLKAREVNVSVDAGHLTVQGHIDASGEQVGSIRLAARDGLSLGTAAVLDAHGSVLRRDSYGQVIEAPNRAVIELDSGNGLLALAAGARMDLGVSDAPAAYGTVVLNAPRLGGARGNDVAIDASAPVRIDGARAITVNAFQTYTDAAAGTDATVDGRSYQVINQAYLDTIHADSTAFIDNALGNGALIDGKLAGLRAYGDQFHLRPGVQISSSADALVNRDGHLHVDGDIDLSGYRYASLNPHLQKTRQYGSGEAGALVLRAAGDLEVFGSISDGFDGSRLLVGSTPDDKGWLLPNGRIPFGGEVVIPHGGVVTLDAGSAFQPGRTLNFDLPAAAMQLPSGTQLPSRMTLAGELALPAGTVLGAAIRDGNGVLLHAAGTVLAQATTLAAGTQLDAGFRVPAATSMAAGTWPAGVPLPVGMSLAQPLLLAKGAILPSETDVKLPGSAESINLRPADANGNQGRTWALAPMLAAGSQSFDLRLVAGADLQAADTRAMARGATGTVRLADTHYGVLVENAPVPGTGIPAEYRWAVDVDADTWNSIGLPSQVIAGEIITQDNIDMLILFGLITSSPLELNGWGLGEPVYEANPGVPPQFADIARPAREQVFSVLRTGTGDLDLVAAGDLQMHSPYGVYTAGTASSSLAAGNGVDPYNQPRGALKDGSLLWKDQEAAFRPLIDGGTQSLYSAWYPEHGGNVLVRAGGNLVGDLIGAGGEPRNTVSFGMMRGQIGSVAIGNWLWRQGTGSVTPGSDGTPVAWWVNFGTYVPGSADGSYLANSNARYANAPFLAGFTGVGTLGGGNLVVEAGGDAGIQSARGDARLNQGAQSLDKTLVPRSQGLNLAVGSSGRMTAAGDLVLTGGGDLDLRIGGSLNPNAELRRNEHDLNSTLVNLRGALRVEAGALGGLQLRYGVLDHIDSRGGDPFAAGRAYAGGGPVLVLGDSSARLDTRGDLVLGGVGDPGRTKLLNATPFTYAGQQVAGEGWSSFSLWTPSTSIDLFSAGGNLTPTTEWAGGANNEDIAIDRRGSNASGTLDGDFYPSILRAVAANGSLYYGVGTTALRNNFGSTPLRVLRGLTLAPAPQGSQFINATGKGELALLAGDSIYASGYAITASTADPRALSSPFNPAFMGITAQTGGGPNGFSPTRIHNAAAANIAFNDWITDGNGRISNASLLNFGSQATSSYAAVGQQPARYYAVQGDIVGLRMGQIAELGLKARDGYRYDGSIPVAIRAGRDISNSGTGLGQKDTVGEGRGNLIAHGHADDISVVQAGRDIRFSTFYVTGPGLLDVSAGRNVYLADKGEIKSLGNVVDAGSSDRASGASIVVAAGMGAGADWNAFAARYLDAVNLADPERPLSEQPGKAVSIYSGELTLPQWLQREFGYSGDAAGADAFLASKQAELDQARAASLVGGGNAPTRSLAREFRLQSQLHLVNWLSTRFGADNGLGLHFDAGTMDARTFFAALPAEQQHAFLRNVYYAELKSAGREYNDANGKRFGSYVRGREAIATLLPGADNGGRYNGDLTLFSSALYVDEYISTNGVGKDRPTPGKTYISKAEWQAMGSPSYGVAYYEVVDAGIHTQFGGDVQIMTPGGRTLVGIDGGFVPGAGSGVMTQGEGDISIYSRDSILLGQSRVFTTFGGNILAWSAGGDINAGRGSKTTVVYTPQRRVYDSVGNVTLSPNTPTTGAGIATLNPIPEIAPGDIDLIAPLGTIDAGEAGIRVSGNVNLAALQVLNADNIQVQGKSAGVPVVAAVNVSALTSASTAANSAVQAAQEMVKRQTQQAQPSTISVQVLGFGEATSSTRPARDDDRYDPDSVVQVVGMGELTAEQRARMATSSAKRQ